MKTLVEVRRGTKASGSRSVDMPRFYFHLHNDVHVPDPEGKELPNLEAALEYAASNALFTMAETLKEQASINLHHHIDIEDERGQVLATVRFKDVAKIEG
jgi:hypothetical protein